VNQGAKVASFPPGKLEVCSAVGGIEYWLGREHPFFFTSLSAKKG